jgi:hypothetical protein
MLSSRLILLISDLDHAGDAHREPAHRTDMSKFLEILKSLIDAVNGVGMQVWAIVIMVIGALLIAIHQAEHGSMIVGDSLALLQHKTPDQK